MRSKGQVFLIAAVVIVSSILVLKAATYNTSSVEERRSFESRLESYAFNNFVAELKNSVTYSIFSGNATRNLHDFANFTKLKAAEHSLELRMVFIGSVANSSGFLNASVVNMMGEEMEFNLTLGGTAAVGTVADYGRWDANFTITPGIDYVMTATYNGTAHSVAINTEPGKDVYNSYLDVTMLGDSSVHKDLGTSSYNLK